MATSTIFRGFTIPVENKSLLLIAKDIASDKYKAQVEEIRLLVSQQKTEEAQEKKKQLLAFTPSGTFKEKRQLPNIDMYSGFVHLDFDKLTPQQLEEAFNIIITIPYTFLCFISPSGNGLKVFVEVNTDMSQHETAYAQVTHFYEQATQLKTDGSCKDITRLCFMSYDPALFKNIYNEKFKVQLAELMLEPEPVQITEQPTELIEEPENLDLAFRFQQLIQFTNQKQEYKEGNRNNYVFLLATNCNMAGISQSEAFGLIQQYFNLDVKEIQNAVNSAYMRNTADHGKFERILLPTEDKLTEEAAMPVLSDAIFDSIPDFLKQVTQVASTQEERDILLLGSLVTLSVAFTKIVGRYRDNPVNANLFIFISAKASAGKGILIHCRKLIDLIHLQLREEAKLLKRQYEIDLQAFNSKKNNDHEAEKPQKPPQKMLFIPANNSATGFLEILNDSDKRGIIFETEGDTLSKAFKSDYGDFSDGFRNAFQHEPISYYRRTDKEYVEIQRPGLSVLLSGTPKQIQTLIPNAENGLFSRFMFYQMNMRHNWDDVFAVKTDDGLDKHFEKLGKQFYSFYQALQAQPEMIFTLTQEQQQKFNDFFRNNQSLYIAIHEDDYIGTVRRLGLTAFRIMMIFSALRMMETGSIDTTMVCNDADFDNTLKMVTVLLKHSSLIYTQIAQEAYKPKPKNRKEQFLDALPYSFNRQGYVSIALSLSIPDKTAQGYIKKFVEAGVLLSPAHDQYINPAASNSPNSAV